MTAIVILSAIAIIVISVRDVIKAEKQLNDVARDEIILDNKSK